MKKILKNKHIVIDGNSIFMRYFYAIPEQFNSDGIPTNGLLAFCKFILNIIRDYDPLSILIVFDKCYDNFRRKIDINYKVNRKKLSNSAKDQLNLSLEFCQKAGFPVEFHAQFEGDDLIGSFVCQNPNDEFVIITTDKDLCQLVNDNVRIFNPFKKNILDTQSVIQLYDIRPNEFPLFLALTGDSSDNIEGVRGVGPKTAVKIVKSILEIGMEDAFKKFPKFNFDNFDMQFQLVSLNKEIKLSNLQPQAIKMNYEYIDEFFYIFNH